MAPNRPRNGNTNGNNNNNNNNNNRHRDQGNGYQASPACTNCGRHGHTAFNCRTPSMSGANPFALGAGHLNFNPANNSQNSNGKQVKTPNRPCRNCNVNGHWDSACPQLPQNQGQNQNQSQNQNQNQQGSQAPSRPCKFCKGPHWNKDCPTRNQSQSQQRIQNNNQYQNQNQPPPNLPCRNCGGAHWESQCPQLNVAAAPAYVPQIQTVQFSRPCRFCGGAHADEQCQSQYQAQYQQRSNVYSEGTVPILGYEAERQWMQRDARANTWVTVHTPYSWGMSQGQVSSDFMVDRDGDVIMADGPSLNASVYVEDEALSPSI